MAKKSSGGQTAVLVIVVLCLIAVVIIALTGKGEKTPTDAGATDTETELRTSDTAANTDTKPKPTSVTTDTDTKTETTADKPHTDTNSSGSTPYVSKNDTRSFQKDQWYMMLVNPDNALPNGFFDAVNDRLVPLKSNTARLMDSRCADDMNAMIDAAKKDGVDLLVCSAYRSYEKQDTNFKNKVEELKKEYQYTEEKAIAETARIIAVPGTSEHHTGLAADIVTPSYQRLNSGFAKTKAFEWLYAHCAEYGFCLRYMEDKQDITKIIYEPWHYRYVGKEAAQIIMSEHLAFEEFLEKYGTD